MFFRDGSVQDGESTVAGFHQPMRVAALAWGGADALQWGRKDSTVDFFDVKGLANRVCEALAEPRRFDELRENARKLIAERYDRDSICVPALLKMLEG